MSAEATSPGGSRASVYGARDLAVGGLEQRVLAANPILEVGLQCISGRVFVASVVPILVNVYPSE